jgi:hypothetical protein
VLVHGGTEYGELTDEWGERRRTGHCNEPGEEQRARPWQTPHRSSDILDILATIRPVDVAGGKEHDTLDHAVVHHVQECSEDPCPAKPQAED